MFVQMSVTTPVVAGGCLTQRRPTERNLLRSCATFALLTIAAFLVSPLPGFGANWAGWRGDGSGVSAETGLPTVWGPSENIFWKTDIEGSGISSPVVWGNRVFLTTAHEKLPFERGPALILALCASLLALALLALGKNRAEGIPSKGRIRTAHRLDRLGTTVALLLCLAGLAFLYVKRGTFGPGLEQRTWNYTGAVGILAGVAAVGLFRARSASRLVGSGVLVAAGVFFLVGMPQSDVTVKQLLLVGVTLCLSCWWCFLFLASPPATQSQRLSRHAAVWQAVGPLALILSAVVQFAVFNYLPRYSKWTRIAVCLDAETGAVLWQQDCFRTNPLKKHGLNSFATPTPVTDGTCVIAQFDAGLVCLDFQGRVKWRKTVPVRSEYIHCGVASSPIMFEQSVIHVFLPDGPNPPSHDALAQYSRMTALDKETGDVKWQVQLPGGHDSYNTPLLVDLAGRPVLLIATWEHVLVYDPGSGVLLRSWDLPVCQCIPSIVASGGRAYVMSGRDHGSQGGFALKLDLENEGTQPDIAWRLRRASADIPSPALCEGLLFMVTKSGIATCLDVETGCVLWRKRFGGSYYSSVVAGDGKVFFTSLEGKTTVVAIGQGYDELAENTIGERCSSSQAIANGRLFIRGEKHLFCIGAP